MKKKLNVTDKSRIVKMYKDGGITVDKIAEIYEVVPSTIRYVLEQANDVEGIAKVKKQGIEQLLINGRELAKMVGVSNRWIELNRHRIIGAQRIGCSWRYNLNVIKSALLAGENIVQ